MVFVFARLIEFLEFLAESFWAVSQTPSEASPSRAAGPVARSLHYSSTLRDSCEIQRRFIILYIHYASCPAVHRFEHAITVARPHITPQSSDCNYMEGEHEVLDLSAHLPESSNPNRDRHRAAQRSPATRSISASLQRHCTAMQDVHS